MTAQRLLRPTVVSMYNYMQPIVASIAAIIMGLGVFGWEKGIAVALVFLGVYIVTKSKSKADFEKEGKEVWDSYKLRAILPLSHLTKVCIK